MSSAQPSPDPIRGFATLLKGAGVELDVTDLADTLWLASKIGPSARQGLVESPIPEDPQLPLIPEEVGSSVPPTENLPEAALPTPPDIPLVSPSQTVETEMKPEGFPLQVPAAPSLRGRLNLSRALRPLKRKIPSPTQRVFDEAATVHQYAEQEILSPVMTPAKERWLDLTLLIEDHPSTFLWEDTLLELKQILERQGAFRQIHTWQIQLQVGRVRLSPRRYGQTISERHYSNPRILQDPTQRQVIWIVSDCTSNLWETAQFQEWLGLWGRSSPLALFQLLPERLWDSTHLGQGRPIQLSATSAGVANSRLKWERLLADWDKEDEFGDLDLEPTPETESSQATEEPSSDLDVYLETGTASDDDPLEQGNGQSKIALNNIYKNQVLCLPVITLEPEPLNQLSRVIAGQVGFQVAGVELHWQDIAEYKSVLERISNHKMSPEERVRKFHTNASPTASKLAGMMAAVPVSLPVVQLIRQTLLPQSRQVHIAEIYMSGLLELQQKAPGPGNPHSPEQPEYDFLPGIRSLLLETVFRDTTEAVLDAVSAYISKRLGLSTRSFEALIAKAPDLAPDQQAVAIPFARVATQTLRQLGGYYRDIAEQLDPNPEPVQPENTNPEPEEAFPPLQILHFETAQLIDEIETNFPAQLQSEEFVVKTLAIRTGPTIQSFEYQTAQLTYSSGQLFPPQLAGWKIQSQQRRGQFYCETLSDDLVLRMVSISGGQFMMGSPDDESQRRDWEVPRHPIKIPAFFMGRYPVTQAQWKIVASYPEINLGLNPNPSNFKGDNRPVEQVNWHEAVEFCARLSATTKRPYRLPSEAEWEYACRAGTTTPFYFGETLTTDIANYNGGYTYNNGPKGKYRKATTPVDHFQYANAYGLNDMHGNVWEWCQDTWHRSYNGAPEDGSAWIGENDNNSSKVRRGGSWIYNPRYCRSASRSDAYPGDRNYFIGFRVVCSAPSPFP
ncbi:formylglycine-generating enzyme family protein [Acaryochloris marina]|uniref:Sulfatase-modifying factor enzyme-like domain-containing protein n=1 Tax=Acaryochloris marina (strain MBIC 11017) TaxID=329726 RepID=A8ZQB5_ACAM1|nr:formylglycine-generating enzyme family protein [Acaryochloris marina]ABW33201.1 conserved hypothetical protein [Acaryochloris marina MBIC11017]